MNLRPLLLLLVVPLAACIDDGVCHQSDVKHLVVPDAGRLNAVAFTGEYGWGMTIVGDRGLVARSPDHEYEPFVSEHPVTADLHAVSPGPENLVFAAGAGGTLIGGHDGATWQVLPSGTTADLWDLEWVRRNGAQELLAVGDEVVLRRDPLAGSWSPIDPPDGGWGHLRAVFANDARVFVVGLAGTVWSSPEPRGVWQREPIGTDADLLAGYGGDPLSTDDPVIVVGVGGTALRRDADVWRPMLGPFEGDLIAVDGGRILTADGTVFRYFDDEGRDPVEQVERMAWTLPGARALRYDLTIAVVGDDALAATVEGFCYRR